MMSLFLRNLFRLSNSLTDRFGLSLSFIKISLWRVILLAFLINSTVLFSISLIVLMTSLLRREALGVQVDLGINNLDLELNGFALLLKNDLNLTFRTKLFLFSKIDLIGNVFGVGTKVSPLFNKDISELFKISDDKLIVKLLLLRGILLASNLLLLIFLFLLNSMTLFKLS